MGLFEKNKQITDLNLSEHGDSYSMYIDRITDDLYVWNDSEYAKVGGYSKVNTYSDLPDATTRTNQIWVTIVDDGYRKKGLYKSNGTTWEAFVVSQSAQEIWAYQDFAPGVITGTSVTLTANNDETLGPGLGYFAVGDIIGASSGIFRASGDGGLPVYTGTTRYFSSKVIVSSQTADSITLSGVPHVSWGAVRIWYKIINRAGQGAYQSPPFAAKGSIVGEFVASLDASDIPFTPVGDIVSGNVAEGLTEVDNKKEKLTNKEDTTLDTSTTKYPTNRLVKEYADAKVADAINNEITAIAPSQNAVFDALSLKEATSNKDASGGYVGLTALKINFKNALNTFTSFFTNSNTATRTYTFQDKDGTIADLVDVATKENVFTKNTAFNKNFGTSDTEVCVGNDARLSDARQCNDTFNDATASKTALGLNNVNNTSDANKPVSTDQQTALDTKFGKATSAEISALINKATPVGNDNLLGEDSANSNSKIRVSMSSVWNASNISSGTINVARLPNISYSKLFTPYESSATATTTTSATPVIIAQVASVVVAEGGLVELFGFGDMNPDDAGSWCSTYLYRDSTLVGKFYTSQGSAASENDCFALGHYDAPGAGTYTYSIKATVGYGTCTFGEGGDGNAPTLMIKVYHP